MATLTAKPDARTATVELSLDDIAGVTALLRSDANGTRPVRLRAEDLPGTGPRVLVDYEPALSGRILYRVQGAAGEDRQAWVEVGADLPRFIIPSMPQFAVVADALLTYNANRRSLAKVHEVIGRSGPLVAAGKLAPRTGRMEVSFPDYSSAKDLLDVLERGQTVLYRQSEHPGLDMYFHAEDVGIEARPDEQEWTLAISFVEVSFPAGPVLSRLGWTFTDLAREYASFDEVAQSFDTFHDLSVGGTA